MEIDGDKRPLMADRWRPPSPLTSPKRTRSQVRLVGLTLAALFVGSALIGLVVRSIHGSRTPRQRQTLVGFSSDRTRRILPSDLQPFKFAPTLSFDDLLAHPLLNFASPLCTLSLAQEQRYAALVPLPNATSTASPPTFLIAANLYNSEAVLPTLIRSLVRVIQFMGPSRFHVSIYENGSDDSTPSQLFVLAQLLRRLDVGYTIVSAETPAGFQPGRRIEGLASLRNAALEPVARVDVDRVLMLNDVFLCEGDIFELLLQHEVQNADMSCGMDYKELRIPEFREAPTGFPLIFYDNWVARDMDGLPFYNISPETGEWALPAPPLSTSTSNALFASHNPFQVYSCFNGISILSSSFFLPSPTSEALKLHPHPDNNDSESECFLLCSDLWRRRKTADGKGARIMVVPRTAVGYSLGDYEKARLDRETFSDEKDVVWRDEPPKKVASYPYGRWNQLEWRPPY